MDGVNLGFIYNGTLFSQVRNGNVSFATTWVDQEDVTLRELSQSQKDG